MAPVPAFEYLDDPVRLSVDMAPPAWQLAGSQMRVTPDTAGGRDIGSHVTLSGTALGFTLGGEIRICARDPLAKHAGPGTPQGTRLSGWFGHHLCTHALRCPN